MATETEKILLDVEFDQDVVNAAITGIRSYRNEQDLLKASQKELEAQGQKNSAQYIKQEAAIKALGTQIKQNQRIVEANASAQRKTEGYINSLKKSISELTSQYDRLSKEELENTQVGGKLEKQIKAQSDELKRLKGNIGDNRLEVGAYKEGIIEAGKQIEIGGFNVGRTLKDIDEVSTKFFGTMITGFKESGLQAVFFGNALRTAFTITGIGLLLVALGTLVAYWDDIQVAIGLADSAQEKFFKRQLEGIEKSKSALEQYNKELDAQNRILELQGQQEDKIFENRRKSLLLDLSLAQKQQKTISDRIISYQQENNLTADILKNREAAARIFGTEDPFVKRINELKKQFDEAATNVVNLKNQLAILDAEQNKFNKEADLKGLQFLPDLEAEGSTNLELRNEQAVNERKEFLKEIEKVDVNAKDRRIKLEQTYAQESLDNTLMLELERMELLKEFNRQQEELDRLKTEFIMSNASRVFQALSGIFDQGTAENKTFALASIGIDTAQAISALTARSEQNPANAFTFGSAAIAQYASGIVRILNNIARAKQLLNFGLGGIIEPIEYFAGGGFVKGIRKSFLLGGKPHSQGGTKFFGSDGTRFEAERNEALIVVNKRDTPMLRTLNSINSRHGRNFLADGGFVARSANQQVTSQISQNTMLRGFENAMKKVKIFTRITDINKLNTRLSKTQVTSELR